MSKIVTLTDTEKEKRLEDEYAFLQRQYRILEKDAVAFSNSSRSTIQTQEILIQKLQDVKHDVMVQVTVAQNPKNTAADTRVEEDINNFLKEGDEIDYKITKTRRYIQEVNNDILRIERDIKKRSKVVLTELDVELQYRKKARQVGLFENRLHASNVKFNLTMAKNKKLQEEVEHYICDRTTFVLAHSKLIRKLTEGIKIMHDVIECGLHKYDEREEAQIVLHSLEERSNLDTKVQTHAMTELQRKYDHDSELKEYLARKSQRRNMDDMEAKVMARRAEKRYDREQLILKYQTILAEIVDFSGEANIVKIATMFTRQEEENFKLYTYATGINRQVELLQEQVDSVYAQIDTQRSEEKQRKTKREESLAKMRWDLLETNSRADLAKRELESSKEELARLFKGVEQLCWKVKADKAKITRLLGDHEHVHQHNYMRHLQLVEHRAVAMRNEVAYVESITQHFNMPLATYIISTRPIAHSKPLNVDDTVVSQPCALCTEEKQLANLEVVTVVPLGMTEVKAKLEQEKMLPEFDGRMHNKEQVCRREKTAMKRRSRENLHA